MIFALWIVLVANVDSSFQNLACGAQANEALFYDGPPEYPHTAAGAEALSIRGRAGQSHIEIAKFTAKKNVHRASREVILSSRDGGKTWEEEREEGPRTEPRGSTAIIRSTSEPVVMYKPSEGTLTRSEDGGRTWVVPKGRIEGSDATEVFEGTLNVRPHKVRVQFAAIHPSNAHTLFGSFAADIWSVDGKVSRVMLPGLYVSTDGGDNWKPFSSELTPLDILASHPLLGISPSDPAVMIGHSSLGLVITTNGGKDWRAVGQRDILEAPVQIRGRQRALAKLRDSGIQLPNEPKWNGLDVYTASFHPDDARVIYLGTSKGIYRSIDQGGSWNLLNLPFQTLYGTNSLIINRDDPREVLVGSVFGAFLSRDGGCHFNRIYPSRNSE